MLTLSEIINQIDIKKLSINTALSYLLSWSYFFITLPFMTKVFGLVKGTTINYFISWGFMLVIMYLLHTTPILSIF
jgi:hypothetical protein